jgi:hypothetical protein
MLGKVKTIIKTGGNYQHKCIKSRATNQALKSDWPAFGYMREKQVDSCEGLASSHLAPVLGLGIRKSKNYSSSSIITNNNEEIKEREVEGYIDNKNKR